MKLSFVFEEDEDVLVGDLAGISKPLARVVVAVARPYENGKIVLTREIRGEFGRREESISFDASEKEILENHLDELLEFLKSPVDK
jgi:hypothetical protein